MAVVFISPKSRQKMFFVWITAIAAIFVALVFLGVFLPQPNAGNYELVFNKPKVNINLEILDTEEFQGLEPFAKMEEQFSYTAKNSKDKQVQGFIMAESLQDAVKTLEGMGLSQILAKEAETGRDNPFSPYYQTSKTTNK